MRLLILLLFNLSALAQSPNLLFILADDLGVDALNGYELATVRPNTPHLDSLRTAGLNFANAWANPVCTPTRAAIMSGKYGVKTGVTTAPGHLDTSHVSLLRAVKRANPAYATGVIGKWHISQPADAFHPRDHGADHYMGILGARWDAYDNWPRTEDGKTTASTAYVSSAFTDDAVAWVKQQRTPWLLWLAHVSPHTPVHVPPAGTYTQVSTANRLQRYLAMIENLDYEIGRLLDGIPAATLANTTIIFAGDNGTPNPSLQGFPAGRGKESLYEGGVRVPLFVSGFGVSRIGETETALVNLLDIYATSLELAGAELPGGIYNSLSFAGSLSAKPTLPRRYNYTEISANGVDIDVTGLAIRDGRFKLIEYRNGEQELYDLLADPLEGTNLLLSTPSATVAAARLDLMAEAKAIRGGWSCRDGIQNGAETGIDCSGVCAICTTGLNVPSDTSEALTVFPNPANDLVTLRSSQSPIQSAELRDLAGRLLIRTTRANLTEVNMDVSNLPSGNYVLLVKRDGRTQSLALTVWR